MRKDRQIDKHWDVIVATILLVVGITFVTLDQCVWKTNGKVFVSIGCSLIASCLFVLLGALKNKKKPLDEWNIKNIYLTRGDMNKDCDVSLKKAKERIDVIAFGLTSFRQQQSKQAESLLN